MAPAAADFQSSFTSKSSSLKNPIFTPFPSDTSLDDRQQSTSATEFDVNNGVASRSGFRTGFSKSGRTRPRLLKLRKQLHGRAKGVSGEFGSGLNPFQSVSESSILDNDCAINSNGFTEKFMPYVNHCPIVSFVFGASNGSCASNLNGFGNLDSKQNLFDMNVEELSSKEESACYESINSLFGDRQNKGSGDEGKSFSKGDNGKLSNADFVFGAKQRRSSEKEGESVQKVENVKLQNFVFEFGVIGNDVERNSTLEKRREYAMDSGICDVGKVSLGTEVENGKNSFLGFELGADENFAKRECGGSVAEPDSNKVGFIFGATDNTFQTHTGLSDTSFVFGASWSNLNDGKESTASLENSVYDETVRMKEDETSNEINGAGNWKEDSNKEKPMNETLESCCSTSHAQNDIRDSSIDGKCKFVSHQSSSSVANVCAAAPVVNLSDELQNLNINSFKNVDGADNKSSTNGDSFFEFRSNNMASASLNGIFGVMNEQSSGNLSNAANGTIVYQFESTDKNQICNTETASDGISSSETFSFQAGVAISSVKDQLSHETVIDEIQGAAAPFPSFSIDLNSYGKVGDSVASSIPQVMENDETCSSSTLGRSGVLFTDFKTPNWDPSSLKSSLFPEVNEKLFSAKGRSKKDTKSRTMRRRLKNLCQLKQQHEQDQLENEGRVQEALNSPGCYSPMDFSPYEENNMACSDSNTEQVCSSSVAGVASAADASGLKGEGSRHMEFRFASGLENIDGRKFSFSASSSAPNKVSAVKRLHRKKNRMKASCEPFVIPANLNLKDKADLLTSQTILGTKSGANELVNHHSLSPTTSIQEACEMWRTRGNQAYKNGDMLKAEDFYTQGIKSVPPGELSGSSLKPLVICFSNRAATRMSFGNMRGALRDCAKAAALDPIFLKVQVRAANCHLMLGETERAQHYFTKCLESAVCLDRRITIEAAEGLQKTEKVVECTNHSAKYLEQRASDAAVSALEVIAEGLQISPYSEKLLEMKAESMFMLRKYEEVIQLCEQTLCSAEKNFTSLATSGQFADEDGSETECYPVPRLWRWHLISKSYFYLGKLESALDLLEKLEQMGSIDDKYANKILESSVSLTVTIRALIHHKSAGNEAVRSGRYAEALEHYTAAISSNIESRPFAAICFCNRAAAHQALGQITDAIADCSLAIALDENYSKAVSRRATLHEMIRDYGQATSDLQRVISLLENISNGKVKESGTPGRSKGSAYELRQARQRLSLMEEENKKGMPLDLYLLLGVKQSDSAADTKKAYRKAALKHHPDKAGQLLPRSESGNEGQLWKDIVQKLHMDADKLFKMIGEAYAVLSDPTKRSEYDVDEEIRKASKDNNGNYRSRRTSDSHSYTYRRRNWQDDYTNARGNGHDHWKTYGQSRSRW